MTALRDILRRHDADLRHGERDRQGCGIGIMRSDGRFWGTLSLVVLGLGVWPGPQLIRELRSARASQPTPAEVREVATQGDPEPSTSERLEPWIDRIMPFCTQEDVDLFVDLDPPPDTEEGIAQEAACFALAGRIPKARALILGLPHDRRNRAVGTVYDVTLATLTTDVDPLLGPVMELVLEFWPNHYLALYHAGSARFMRGDLRGAALYLHRFLELYVREDQLAADAHRMLAAARGY
jgi:hypothetical protein